MHTFQATGYEIQIYILHEDKPLPTATQRGAYVWASLLSCWCRHIYTQFITLFGSRADISTTKLTTELQHHSVKATNLLRLASAKASSLWSYLDTTANITLKWDAILRVQGAWIPASTLTNSTVPSKRRLSSSHTCNICRIWPVSCVDGLIFLRNV